MTSSGRALESALLRARGGRGALAAGAGVTAILTFQRVAPVWVASRFTEPTERLAREAVVLGGLLVASSVLERALRAFARHRLVPAMHIETLTALLNRGSEPSPSQPGREDDQRTVFEGLDAGEELFIGVVPNTVADAASVALILPLAVARGGASGAALAVPVVLAAAFLALVSRKRAAHALAEAEATYDEVVDGLVLALKSREELALNDARPALRAAAGRATAEWARASTRWTLLQFVLGRMPLVVVAIAAGVLVWGRGEGAVAWRDGVTWGALATLLVNASVGVYRGMRARARLRRIEALVGGLPIAESRIAQEPPFVRARELMYRYPGALAPAVADASLACGPGDICIVTGPNGSGKSTLLRLIAGALQPNAGSLTKSAGPLGFLGATPYLPERSTAREAIALYAESFEEEDPILVALGIGPRRGIELDRVVGAMSLGQKKRIAVARVLLRRAPIVILDEPDAHLDRASVERLGNLLRELGRDCIVVLAAHGEVLSPFATVRIELALKGSSPAESRERGALEHAGDVLSQAG